MWIPKDGYNGQGFYHWYCYHTITLNSRGNYRSYDEANNACRRLNGTCG